MEALRFYDLAFQGWGCLGEMEQLGIDWVGLFCKACICAGYQTGMCLTSNEIGD